MVDKSARFVLSEYFSPFIGLLVMETQDYERRVIKSKRALSFTAKSNSPRGFVNRKTEKCTRYHLKNNHAPEHESLI